MGTWSAEILGNDTSAQTWERFFALYDAGQPIPRIIKTVEKELRTSLATAEDRANVELALALALWECKALDAVRRARVRTIVKSGEDLAACASRGATDAFLSRRARALNSLLKKVSRAPARARPRLGKPEPFISTSLKPGTCFALKHSSGYAAFWISSCSAGRTFGDFGVVCLDLDQRAVPTMADCERAYALGMTPEARGRWRGAQYLVEYETATKQRLISAMSSCCVVLGRTRALKTPRMLWGTSAFGGRVTDARSLRKTLLAYRAAAREDASRKHRLGAVLHLLMGGA